MNINLSTSDIFTAVSIVVTTAGIIVGLFPVGKPLRNNIIKIFTKIYKKFKIKKFATINISNNNLNEFLKGNWRLSYKSFDGQRSGDEDLKLIKNEGDIDYCISRYYYRNVNASGNPHIERQSYTPPYVRYKLVNIQIKTFFLKKTIIKWDKIKCDIEQKRASEVLSIINNNVIKGEDDLGFELVYTRINNFI